MSESTGNVEREREEREGERERRERERERENVGEIGRKISCTCITITLF